MNDQSFDVSYRVALNAANTEMDKLLEEAKRLRNRMEQIDEAVSALKLVLEPAEPKASESIWMNPHHDPALSVAVA